ncbi:MULTISPECIES: ABC transporter substrate-binding protein [Micromonospora]|uniref:NitT/TauT family transport system substrate-binding protein n=1 Tax=Micromonospora yangpuensis TaxID=683228 RepID=A0A1C6V955_9ACTN|nr:ABC transporter substrate-binding protein [Micromonospora yangpuensis]GGM31873.1 lipoprotein [Micromonospora yangpuensis]SCL62687.1 NitT/TauT family transport system substrate-binding protein [Micromonospora yangpuensis]
MNSRTLRVLRERGARTLAATVAALLAVTVLAACGEDEAAGGGAGGEATELRLGLFPNITHAPALVGVQNGIFAEKLGGDVKLSTTPFNAGPSAIEALFNGAIDATYIGPNPAINGWAQSKGTALHIIAGSTSGGAALVVKPGINGVPDLRGKKIATPQLGNTQDVALRYWLKQQGLKTDTNGGGDVSVLPTPNSEIITAFGSGALDGAWVPEPHLSRLIIEHGAKVLKDEKDEWPGGQFVTTHLIVRKEFLDKNPGLVKKLLEGHVAAVDFVNGNREAAAKAANEQLKALSGNTLKDEILTASFANLTFTVDPIAPSLYGSAKHAEEVDLLDPVDLNGIYQLGPLNEILKAAGKPEVSAEGGSS